MAKKSTPTPQQMTVIGNIQSMRQVIFGKQNLKEHLADFDSLCNESYDTLFEMQKALIPDYNAAIKAKK